MRPGSNQPYDQQNHLLKSDSDEISLNDVINFLIRSWKKIVLVSLLGALLGFGLWLTFAGYKANLMLINHGSLDIITWRQLQKSLPNLADQILEEKKIPDDKIAIYRQMSVNDWWQKNITATYAMSKSDTKDLASISKDLDNASTQILNLNISSGGATRDEAYEHVRSVSQFLLTGGAYLQVRSMLNGYEGEVVAADADVERKMNATEIELAYLQERLKNWEGLLKRFPEDQKLAQQVADPKDSGAKYLPIKTQIIAINSDINANHEALERLKDRVAQIKMLKAYVQGATPLVEQHFDGILLVRELLDLEGKLRAQLQANDLKSQLFLDQLRARLLGIEVRFTKGLEANTAPNAKKAGMMKAIAVGLFIGFFLALLVLLGQGLWEKIRVNKALTSK